MKFWKALRIVSALLFVLLILVSVYQRYQRVQQDDADQTGTPFIIR